jgi:hypothetical protein
MCPSTPTYPNQIPQATALRIGVAVWGAAPTTATSRWRSALASEFSLYGRWLTPKQFRAAVTAADERYYGQCTC